MKQSTLRALASHKMLQQVFASIVIVAFLFRVSLLLVASTVATGTDKNMHGLGSIVDGVIVILATFLGYAHGNIYELNVRKKLKLDERLIALRRGVYEKSFQVLVAMLFITMFVCNFAVLGSGGFSLHFSEETGNAFSIGILFFVLSIPAIIASIQREP